MTPPPKQPSVPIAWLVTFAVPILAAAVAWGAIRETVKTQLDGVEGSAMTTPKPPMITLDVVLKVGGFILAAAGGCNEA